MIINATRPEVDALKKVVEREIAEGSIDGKALQAFLKKLDSNIAYDDKKRNAKTRKK